MVKDKPQDSLSTLENAALAFTQLIEKIAEQALDRSWELPSLAETQRLASDALRELYEAYERHHGQQTKHNSDRVR